MVSSVYLKLKQVTFEWVVCTYYRTWVTNKAYFSKEWWISTSPIYTTFYWVSGISSLSLSFLYYQKSTSRRLHKVKNFITRTCSYIHVLQTTCPCLTVCSTKSMLHVLHNSETNSLWCMHESACQLAVLSIIVWLNLSYMLGCHVTTRSLTKIAAVIL